MTGNCLVTVRLGEIRWCPQLSSVISYLVLTFNFVKMLGARKLRMVRSGGQKSFTVHCVSKTSHDMGRKKRGAGVLLSVRAAGSSSNTMSPGPRTTAVPRGILIHPNGYIHGKLLGAHPAVRPPVMFCMHLRWTQHVGRHTGVPALSMSVRHRKSKTMPCMRKQCFSWRWARRPMVERIVNLAAVTMAYKVASLPRVALVLRRDSLLSLSTTHTACYRHDARIVAGAWSAGGRRRRLVVAGGSHPGAGSGRRRRGRRRGSTGRRVVRLRRRRRAVPPATGVRRDRRRRRREDVRGGRLRRRHLAGATRDHPAKTDSVIPVPDQLRHLTL